MSVGIKRREFLKGGAAALAGAMLPGWGWAAAADDGEAGDEHVRDYLYRMRNFDASHAGDIRLSGKEAKLLRTTFLRLKRVQRQVGYANFSLLGFDEAIKTGKSFGRVGRFSRDELAFLEKIFYGRAEVYGFLGTKPLTSITDRIDRAKVVKIPRTGHYLYKGLPLETYGKIRRDVGTQAILTSGVRSVSKQFYLFLNKAVKNGGNLSLASRSLAPPGYSFHAVGDFDVGLRGFGAANFTRKFTTTDVYKKLCDLGYVRFRYQPGNPLGVRFEPWHVKVGA